MTQQTQSAQLSSYPQISHLYEILEKNGFQKEKEDFQFFVEYLEKMESHLFTMLSEVQKMHSELSQNQPESMTKSDQILTQTEEKIQETKKTVTSIKEKIRTWANNTINSVKTQGKSVLRRCLEDLEIPSLLSSMKDGFSKAAQYMRESEKNLDVVYSELHKAGSHLQNAGRALALTDKKTTQEKNEKGFVKLKSFLETCSKVFDEMSTLADDTIKAIHKLPQKKTSLKARINDAQAVADQKNHQTQNKNKVRQVQVERG